MAVEARGAPVAFAADAQAAQARCERTYRAISRSVGAAGAHALLNRALGKAMLVHPALKSIRIEGMSELGIRGVSEMAQVHGERSATVAILAVHELFLESLANLIGDDLVTKLLANAIPDSLPGHKEAP